MYNMNINREKVVRLVRQKLKNDEIDIKRDIILKCSKRAINNISYEIDEEEIASSVYSAIKLADKSNMSDENHYMNKNIEANNIPNLSDIDSYKRR